MKIKNTVALAYLQTVDQTFISMFLIDKNENKKVFNLETIC
jgi:hypothetical protein